MRHFDNKTTAPPSPMSYREARKKMRSGWNESRDRVGIPIEAYDTLVQFRAASSWRFDFARLLKEDPALAQSLMQSEAESNGDIIVPPQIEEDLIRRGYLFEIDGTGKEQPCTSASS